VRACRRALPCVTQRRQFNALVVTPILERVKTAGLDDAKKQLAEVLAKV
jgi:hypothetical protein